MTGIDEEHVRRVAAEAARREAEREHEIAEALRREIEQINKQET